MRIIVARSRAARNIKVAALQRTELRVHRAHHKAIADFHSSRASVLRDYLRDMLEETHGIETPEVLAVRAEIDRCDIIAMENMNSSCMGKEESWHEESPVSAPFNIPGM